MMVITTLMAVLSGACNAGLIAMVNLALTHGSRSTTRLLWAFIALGLGKIITNYFSQVVLARFSQGAIAELRRDLIRKILAVPLRSLEEIGAPRVLVGLTEDVFNISQALLSVPVVSVNIAILFGGAAYLGWLSWQILGVLIGLILFGAVGYRLLVASAYRRMNLARAEEDKLYGYFRALTEGIKELKLHRKRRIEFFARNIQTTTEAYQRHNVAAETQWTAAQSWSHLLYFALIGLILFLVPRLGEIDQRTLTGYVITTLYLMGPLAGVLSSFSMFGRASVALQHIQKLGVSLAEQSVEDCPMHELSEGEAFTPLRAASPDAQPVPEDNARYSAHVERFAPTTPFERLELVHVVHSYRHEQDDSNFVLGPIDLTFHPGELVFLVGGNGSGKSTLAKILSGLYLPEAGEIRLDGEAITHTNRDDYRQLFSAVFADFYLFDNLLGLHRPGLDAQAEGYLEHFHLAHKVKIKDGNLSTTSVSQGQRKRLALLTAYLEDRPFYLFDEWASDQDPHFKNVFYTQLLPELKARGKTVLVITHDDKYFHVADRIIKLDYGKLAPQMESGQRPLAPNGKPAFGRARSRNGSVEVG
jgi:putative ATP-binding cassette transporter